MLPVLRLSVSYNPIYCAFHVFVDVYGPLIRPQSRRICSPPSNCVP